MKYYAARAIVVIGLFCVFCGASNAQQADSKKKTALKITGKTVTMFAKAAAKATYETVKFTGKYLIKPAFKNVIVPAAKSTPSLAAKTAKLTAKGIKKGAKAISDRDRESSEDKVPAASN